MDTPDSSSGTYAGAANKLIQLLSDTAAVWLEPAKIRRVAEAKADESRILTEAELARERSMSDARFRLQALELRRQKNLELIATLLAREAPTAQLKAGDEDWLVEFVESCKDTADPTLQDVWAKLLAGEMEATGSCSKRTLHKVKAFSRDEALLVKEVCRRVCIVVEADGHEAAFLNVVVNRAEMDFGVDDPKFIPLYIDGAPNRRERNERLIACGFLGGGDFKFHIHGEGPLVPEKFGLSASSPRKLRFGTKALAFDMHQPGLLFETKTIQRPVPSIRTPAASIEFDAWKLSPEGFELYRALREEPDYEFMQILHQALRDGGLAVSAVDEGSTSQP